MSASPAYPITYRGQSYSYTCAAQTGYQPCNWLESPHLLGENVMTVGQGAMDMDFPFMMQAMNRKISLPVGVISHTPHLMYFMRLCP